jgi:hypothetical protein
MFAAKEDELTRESRKYTTKSFTLCTPHLLRVIQPKEA